MDQKLVLKVVTQENQSLTVLPGCPIELQHQGGGNSFPKLKVAWKSLELVWDLGQAA